MDHNTNSNLNIISANVQSLISTDKKIALTQFLKEYNPEIMCTNETWLKPFNTLQLDGYNIVNKDREGEEHARIAICLKKKYCVCNSKQYSN
jgi:exonuclease III